MLEYILQQCKSQATIVKRKGERKGENEYSILKSNGSHQTFQWWIISCWLKKLGDYFGCTHLKSKQASWHPTSDIRRTGRRWKTILWSVTVFLMEPKVRRRLIVLETSLEKHHYCHNYLVIMFIGVCDLNWTKGQIPFGPVAQGSYPNGKESNKMMALLPAIFQFILNCFYTWSM